MPDRHLETSPGSSPPPARPVRGVIFDLDGTLVDSGLDFEAMRREMGLPAGRPILEAIDRLDAQRASECREILARHEWEGARQAQLMPGVLELVAELRARGLRQSVLTRNCRAVAVATLARLSLEFDPVVAREDAPAKPDPAAIWRICEHWQLPAAEVAVVGDFHFDIEAGRRAGAWTVLYTAGREPSAARGADRAHYCLRSFVERAGLLAWLAQPI